MTPKSFGPAAKIVGALILTLALFLVGTLAWIQTESGSRWLLGRIKSGVEAQPGVTLDLQAGNLDPFSGLTLQGMKLAIKRDGINLSLDIPRMEAHYSIAWFSRALTLNDFTIEGLTLSGTVVMPETAPPSQSEPADWSQLQRQLESPPASAAFQNIRIHHASVDLKVERKGIRPFMGAVRFADADAEFDGGLHPGRIAGRMKLNLANASNRITFKTSTPKTHEDTGRTDELEFSPSAMFAGSFELTTPGHAGSTWNFDLKGEKNVFRISNLIFTRTFDQPGSTPWKININEQEIEATARATPEKVSFSLQQSGSPVVVRLARTLPLIQPGFSAEFSTSPDLKNFAFLSAFKLNHVPVLQVQGQGGLESDGAKLEVTARVHADSRLSVLAPSLKPYPAIDLDLSSEIWIATQDTSAPPKVIVKKLSGSFLGAPFLSSNLTGESNKNGTTAEGAIELHLPSPLFGFLKKAGLWDVSKRPILVEAEKALMPAGFSTQFKAAQDADGTWIWEGHSTLKGMGSIAGASFDQGLEFHHRFSKSGARSGAKSEGTFTVFIPQANWKGELEAWDTKLEARFRKTGETQPTTEMSWSAEQKSLTARDPTSHKPIPLEGLRSTGQISISDQGTISGKEIMFSLHRDLLRAEVSLSGNQRTGRAELAGTVKIRVPSRFPDIAGNHLAGGLEIPWTMQVREGREILLQGDLRFQDLAWSNGKYGFKGLSGRIPMTEALTREGETIRLARIETPNAFERVDFERIQPYLLESQKLSLLEIQYEDRKIGPFFGFLSVYQNLISVNQFNLKMGSEGRAYGEFYVDANPAQLQMGILSRLTGLDLDEVLPSRMLKKSPSGSKQVSGRTGLVMNLTKNSVEGRIDITEIGGSQLVTLMRALDPKGKDEKINRAATALGIAYPTFVGMVFNNGQLDMKVDMSLPAPSMTIRGIPIAGSIASTFAPMRTLLARAGYSEATAGP